MSEFHRCWVGKNLARQKNGAAGDFATFSSEGGFLPLRCVIATTQTQPHLPKKNPKAWQLEKEPVYLFRVHVPTQATEIEAEEEFISPRQLVLTFLW